MKYLKPSRPAWALLSGLLLAPSAQADLLVYYPFDTDGGATVPNSGTGGDGTAIGGVTYGPAQSPAYGTALVGNRSGLNDAFVETNLTGTDLGMGAGGVYTAMAWINWAGVSGSNDHMIFGQLDGDGNNAQLHHGIRSEGPDANVDNIHFGGWGGPQDIGDAGTVPPNTWTHVAWQYDGADKVVYVNGVESSRAGGNNITNPALEVIVGGHGRDNAAGVPAQSFNGSIDEVKIYDEVLTATEIMTAMLPSGTDTDNDGLTDDDEINIHGTDPNDPDTDDDGMEDGAEVRNGLDPNSDVGDDGASGDPDSDDLTNIDEVNVHSTDPLDDDSDDDTLTDGDEINVYSSNPNSQDTDGDTLTDGDEVNVHSTDPAKADTDDDTMPDNYELDNMLDPTVDDAALDPDADNLTNVAEFGLGTDPQDADTDDDFSNDDVEGTNATDPLLADTDGDGLLDGHETNNGENSYNGPTDTGTDPLVGDTDADGTSDGREVPLGRDPTVSDPQDVVDIGDGLVSYWNFDNNLDDIAHSLGLGDSAVADNGVFSGAGADTDVGYATEENALFGSSALTMNGGAGWVTVTESIDTRRQIENAVSVSAWVKASAWDVNWQAIIAHGEGNHWRMARHAGNDSAAWVGGAGDIFGAGEIVPGDGTWHHIVGVADPVNFSTSIYIDGTLAATGAAPALDDRRFADGGYPDLFIGANSQGANREWNGEIDDVAIWARPLTADEVALIYNGGDGESIENLVGGSGPPRITAFTFDPSNGANGAFTLTFSSRNGATYSIWGSNDLNDGFPIEVEDTVTGEDGSTSVTFARPAGAGPLFYRVEPPRE